MRANPNPQFGPREGGARSHASPARPPPCRRAQGVFIISPRVTFEVPVRILGGLMALGYEIGTIMRRTSVSFTDDK